MGVLDAAGLRAIGVVIVGGADSGAGNAYADAAPSTADSRLETPARAPRL
jgi:hypothetical protein